MGRMRTPANTHWPTPTSWHADQEQPEPSASRRELLPVSSEPKLFSLQHLCAVGLEQAREHAPGARAFCIRKVWDHSWSLPICSRVQLWSLWCSTAQQVPSACCPHRPALLCFATCLPPSLLPLQRHYCSATAWWVDSGWESRACE